MKSLATIIPDNVINALGWTIFHSLWQGLIIGLILLMIFKFRSNISSQARYVLGGFALAAIFFSSLFTFLVAFDPISSHADLISYTSGGISGVADISETADILSPGPLILSGWQKRLTGTFYLVSIVWFVGVLLLTARLAGGMMVVRGMRRQSISPMPAGWEQRLRVIAARTGLHRSITYLQSQKVMVPTVIGILRPVVLIPSMIISGLPADQLETIIVHELAHIRRHDFLVNIMQSIMEALFFYHPVVWIISENIRQDREKCCDDYTVRICGQVSLYARALACLSELQITAAVPSVAITGNKKNLLQRVERLINNKKMKTNKTERLIAGLVLVTSVLVITLSTGATIKPSGFTQLESQIVQPFWDKDPAIPVTDPEPVTQPVAVTAPTAVAEPVAIAAPTATSEPAAVTAPTIVLPSIPAIPALPADTSHRHHREKMDIKDNTVTREFHNKEGEDTEMKFVIKQGKVEELYVDGQRIPDNEFPRYQKEIEKTMDDLHDMEKDLKHARVELDNVDFDKIREEIKTEMEHFKQHEMIDLQEDMMKLQEEQIKVHLDQHELQAEIERAMKDVQIDQEKMQEEMFKAQEEIKKAMEEFEDGNNELSEEEFEQAMKEMELGMAEAKKAMAMMETVEMQEMMEKALKSVQEIDHENIQKEIEEALKHIEEIDFAQIEKEMQSAMLDMEKTKIDLDKEKNNIDEMIEELEKLELDNK